MPDKYPVNYTRSHRVGLWRQLRNDEGGQPQECHLTGGACNTFTADPEWQALGYAPAPPEHADVRECAGYVAAARRELRRLQECGTYETYAAAYPHGLTRRAAEKWTARLRAGDVREIRATDAEIIDPALDDEPTPGEMVSVDALQDLLTAAARELAAGRRTQDDEPTRQPGETWTPEQIRQALPQAALCDCLVCARHDQVHPHTETSVLGTSVRVETRLLDLVETMVAAGLVPVASCSDLADAVRRTDPERIEELRTQVLGSLHYGHIINRGAGYVRFVLADERADVAVGRLRGVPGVTVRTGRVAGYPLAQVEIKQGRLHDVTGAVRSLCT